MDSPEPRRHIVRPITIFMVLFAASSCSPTAPDGIVEIHLTGQVVNTARRAVAGAQVRIPSSRGNPAVATTDELGAFDVTGMVPPSMDTVQLFASHEGFTAQAIDVSRTETQPVVITLTGPLIIAAGEMVEGHMTAGPTLPTCTLDSIPCMGLVVDGTPSDLIDLTLVPLGTQSIGLFPALPVSEGAYAHQLTVHPGLIWIMGSVGAFTVTAAFHGGPESITAGRF